MADIIKFPEPELRSLQGNGAREALREYFGEIHSDRSKARPGFAAATAQGDLSDEDYFLAWLYNEGFKVVPIEADDV